MPLKGPDAEEDAAAWLRVAFARGVPRALQRELLSRFGSPQAVLQAARADPVLSATGAGLALRAESGGEIDLALRWLEAPGHHLLALGDPRYPQALLHTVDPPTVLLARGEPRFLDVPSIAIVGSRNASPQGAEDARVLAHALSEAGLCIVSGLALGIDAAAHRGGLDGQGSSVAVMGTGPDRLYPRSNTALALEIERKGCLVTEFPLGMPGHAKNFPQRNRVISGLCLGVVVIEAAMESGSLHTARSALDQGREVLALPGSIHSPLSKGCHHLIRQGAMLVQSASEVLQAIAWETGPRPSPLRDAIDESPPDPVLNAVGYAPTSMVRLAEATGLPIPRLCARLTQLEIEGRITALPGGRFARRPKDGSNRVIE